MEVLKLFAATGVVSALIAIPVLWIVFVDQPTPVHVALPSPADIQRLLNKLEPENPVKVDGKIGPLTLEKWNRLYIEQSAKKASEGFYK